MMEELLTAKQVEQVLQVDRTTIYRMLDDGRLKGVKVGQQWRFPLQSIKALMAGKPNGKVSTHAPELEVLPIHCLQPIQDVFAEVMGIGAVTTTPDGEPLTIVSNPCGFCRLMLASQSGRTACIASWRGLAQQSSLHPHFAACHAGLEYARARIEVDGTLAGMLVAGQFYVEEPAASDEAERVQTLAQTHGIDENALRAAGPAVPRLDDHRRSEIGRWLERVAHSFEEFSSERENFIARLKNIAAMSTLDPTFPIGRRVKSLK